MGDGRLLGIEKKGALNPAVHRNVLHLAARHPELEDTLPGLVSVQGPGEAVAGVKAVLLAAVKQQQKFSGRGVGAAQTAQNLQPVLRNRDGAADQG